MNGVSMAIRTTRARLAAVGLLSALALVTTACGGAIGERAGASGQATMWGITGAPMQNILEQSVEDWSSAHPDQQIAVDFFGADAYKSKVRTAVGADEGPTLIYGWGGGGLKAYVDAGKVLDLTPYLADRPQLRDRYAGAVADNGVIDGRTYGIPNNAGGPVMLYYNKTLFAEAGVAPPATWGELMALVGVFAERGVAPIALAGQSRWTSMMWLEYLVDRIGGAEVFKSVLAGEPNAWAHPAMRDALVKIQELVAAGGFAEGFSSIAADNKADQALLHTGRAAMLLQLGGTYAAIKNDAPDFVDQLGYVPFPIVEGGTGDPRNLVGNPANVWSISAQATPEQRDTALDYLTEAVFDKPYVDAFLQAGSAPAVVGIEDQLNGPGTTDYMRTVYGWTTGAPNYQLSWDQALAPDQAAALLTNLELVFLQQQTPDQFIAAMNATIA
jgi:raffinose/stachyose/melibiose transport system substrate-binding protein